MKTVFVFLALFYILTYSFATEYNTELAYISSDTTKASLPTKIASLDNISFQVDTVSSQAMEMTQLDTSAVAVLVVPEKKTSRWKFTHLVRLNLSQTAYFYWAAGGDNSWATNAFYTFTANYKNENWAWDTKLDTDYGLVYLEPAKKSYDFSWRKNWKKNADKLQISTIFGYTHNNRLYYSFLGEFKTQYSPNTFVGKYSSAFMAPGYLNMGLGADYKHAEPCMLLGLIPIKDFTAFVSPFTARFTFVLNDDLAQAGAFGVERGQHVKEQMGMSAKIAFKTAPIENVDIATTLNLFTPYEDKFLNFVVGWDAVIAMKVNKYLSTTIHMSLQYDEKIEAVDRSGEPQGGPRMQFKEILGIGLSYTF